MVKLTCDSTDTLQWFGLQVRYSVLLRLDSIQCRLDSKVKVEIAYYYNHYCQTQQKTEKYDLML